MPDVTTVNEVNHHDPEATDYWRKPKIGEKAEHSRPGDSAADIPGIRSERRKLLKKATDESAQRHEHQSVQNKNDQDR